MVTKKILIILAVLVLFVVCPAKAVIWTGGYHQIKTGDVYGEVDIYNDVILDIFGGNIFTLDAFDITITNWYDGQMDILRPHDDSIVNIYGGTLDTLGTGGNSIVNLYGGNLNRLGITDNGLLNLYAYDVIYHPTGGLYDRGWIEGRYIRSDLYFNLDFVVLDTFSHINIIPEPSTLFLLSLGCLLFKKQKKYKILNFSK
jgi:hypothetical protein